MLNIKNLHAGIEEREILKGINLEIKPGEVHAIMGPNGAGKSTLSSVIAGKEEYEVTEGEILFEGEEILEDAPEERAHKGIFLSFQYPVEIPGVSVTNFIKAAMNETRKAKGLEEMPAKEMLALIREKSELLEIKKDFLSRSLNEGFSGGEKKRNEIFQMMMLDPKLAILDETDSGLDIDALRIVADGVNKFRNEGNAVLVITHYQRLLNYIQPDFIVDITEFWDTKVKSIAAFGSQFYDPESKEPASFISSPEFLPFIESRAREFGHRIQSKYGEGFTVERFIGVSDLFNLK
jgi:Fe-S cluster assembly ATP-binding protein